MKKFMAMLLALVMALSLVACGQKADDTKKDDAADTDDSLVVLENVVDWGETEPYRVLVQKGDPKGLLEGINKAIAELTANDGALIKEIEDKVASQDTYMPDAVSSDLAAETTDDTAASDKPVLVMGTSPDYPPYEFFADAAMTEYAGIDVEVAKYIAESMGMTLQIESMNFDNLVTSLSNGDFDVVLAACEYTEERAKACDFSDPYYTDLPAMILVKADAADQYNTLADFAGKSVGAQTATTKEAIVTDQMEGANLVSLSLVTDLVNELVYGKVDAIVVDGAVAEQYAESNPDLVVAPASSELGEAQPYCIAVAKGDPKGLLPGINEAIAKMTSENKMEEFIAAADELSGKAVEVTADAPAA